MDTDGLEKYRISARERHEKELKLIEERYTRAYSIALKASEILKSQYNTEKVIVFGSLADKERFRINSDIDLATQGLDDKYYFHAISRLIDLDPQIKIDLIRLEDASESLKNVINYKNIII